MSSDFVVEDSLNSSEVSDSADNATILENTTAAPSDSANNMTEDNMTGKDAMEQMDPKILERMHQKQFENLPQGVRDLLQNTTEPGE